MQVMKQPKEIKKIVQEGYKEIATSGGSCCCESKRISSSIGYSHEDMELFSDANMGLGCGNPTAISELKPGDVVLDLGSGAGFDAFIAAKGVGKSGKVIGVDMTPEMVKKATENAKKMGFENTVFVLGDIEQLPIEDQSIDIVISNCVINLAPNKEKVFKEAYRVLKRDGRLYLSDIVLLEPLSEEMRNDKNLITGCVAGALLKEEYLQKLATAKFHVELVVENKEISKTQYRGIPLESITIRATKK